MTIAGVGCPDGGGSWLSLASSSVGCLTIAIGSGSVGSFSAEVRGSAAAVSGSAEVSGVADGWLGSGKAKAFAGSSLVDPWLTGIGPDGGWLELISLVLGCWLALSTDSTGSCLAEPELGGTAGDRKSVV